MNLPAWVVGALDFALDRSVEELFGAILLALVIAATGAVAGQWLVKGRADITARLTGLMLVVSLVSMLIGGTYVSAPQSRETPDGRFPGDGGPGVPIGPPLPGDDRRPGNNRGAAPRPPEHADPAAGFRPRRHAPANQGASSLP